MAPFETKYVTEKYVAELTGIALSTLRNDRFHKRGIPYIKFRRSVRYDLREVIEFMESHKIRTGIAEQDSRAEEKPFHKWSSDGFERGQPHNQSPVFRP